MLTVHHLNNSRSQRVLWLLEELGAAYEIVRYERQPDMRAPKELRAIHNYSFYDDPSRMLRMIRFKVRLGYAIDERTKLQAENAREAGMLTRISPEALGAELRHIAKEPNAAAL